MLADMAQLRNPQVRFAARTTPLDKGAPGI
jgi:hypothetical protein